MRRYLLLVILIAGSWVCSSGALASNPGTAAQSAPAAATATHAIDAVSAPTPRTATQATPASAPAAATASQAMSAQAPAAAATAAAPAPTSAPSAATTATPQVQSGAATSLPTRGMSMANVEHIFGVPQEKIPAVPDPGTKLHPPITRWVYPDYVVYFEYNYVVHTVLKSHPFSSGGNN